MNDALAGCPVPPAPSLYPGRKFNPDGRSGAVADLNQDGAVDVITANMACEPPRDELSLDPVCRGDVSVLLGVGDGTLGPAERYKARTGDGPATVAVAVLNADGVPDLVTANAGSSGVSVLLGLPRPAPNGRNRPPGLRRWGLRGE